MRQFLPLFVAFTLGVLACAVHYEREESDLKADSECNYHTGYDDGFRSGQFEERKAQERYSVVYKDVTP